MFFFQSLKTQFKENGLLWYQLHVIILYGALGFRFENPYQEYVLRDDNTGEIVMDPYYPCIKYKNPADPNLDGTDYFIIAESMHLNRLDFSARSREWIDCFISFTCDKDQKAFYKLLKDCLRLRLHKESFYFFRKHTFFSLTLTFDFQ